MEEVVLTMENNTSRGAKGFSLGDWRQKALPRKRLSDISNLSISGLGDELVLEDQEKGRTISSVMVNDYFKLLKEKEVLMTVLAEKDAEVQKLRLMVGKVSQQNWLLAHANSQMLTEFNLGKDRLKAAQHELCCTSTALKVKSQELEELKKLNRENKRMQKISTQGGHLKPSETAGDASELASQKKTCPNNRKRPQRSLSLGPIANQVTTKEKDETQRRKSLRRKSICPKVELCVPTEDLFEIEDVKFPICSGDKRGSKDGDYSLQPSTRSIPNINKVKEENQDDQYGSTRSIPNINKVKEENQDDQYGSTRSIPNINKVKEENQQQYEVRRTSLGRPLRKAAEKVNSYKELPLKTKLRSEL